jgi:hypothetical protein
LSFSAGRLLRFVLPKSFVIQDPPLFVLLPRPLACLRYKTSCIRDPNSILLSLFLLSDLSLFCPSYLPVLLAADFAWAILLALMITTWFVRQAADEYALALFRSLES